MREGTKAQRHEGTKKRAGGRATCVLAMVALLGLAGVRPALAQEVDEDEGRFVVIRARKIITNTGKEIRNGLIVLSGGKIRSVGRGLEYPLSARIIDAPDRVVMPGLIDPHSRYGLNRYARTGVHGNLTVADEYYLLPDIYEDLLDAGYTVIALVPDGGGIPGRALVVHTGGAEEQATLLSPAYLRVTADKRTFRGGLEKAQKEIEKVEKARKEFEKKQKEQQQKEQKQKKEKPAEKKPPVTQPATQPATQPTTQPAFKPPPIDPAHQALVDLIEKKPDIFALIELRNASDFVHMSEVLEEFEIAHHFLASNSSQSDLEYVVGKLGEQEEQLILMPRIGRVPYSVERIHLVRMFSEAGCEVSLTPMNDSATEYQRTLGRVAELVREGWSREEALKALTLHPARLLGLDARLGSIEKGKDADLIFLDADPFDPTARVREVMIAGEIIHRVEDFD